MSNFDKFATEIAERQYFQPGETTVEEMLHRAATVVNGTDVDHDYYYQLMLRKRFIPGGRILAGAGTAHGNLLNCFVQDESPFIRGTDGGALHLAKKLALVTRVGGGNGLNLDAYKPKEELTDDDKDYIGNAYVYIDGNHPQWQDVQTGTFYDIGTASRVTKGYRTAHPVTDILAGVPASTVPVRPEDDTSSIWDAARDMVMHMLDGKDVVVDLSALRPEDAPVRGSGGTSSGPASFAVEVFDNFATWAKLGGAQSAGPVATLRYLFAPTLRVIRQGGVRRGAGMATLAVEHPDILDFITAKDLDREQAEGDIGTFNMSVLADREWLHDDANRDVLRKIAHHAWATGEPGMLYVDRINEHNVLKDAGHGPILATNPCGEIPLYPGEPCDLGAMNVSEYVVDGEMDWESLYDNSYDAADYLDRILDVENAPLPEIREAIDSKRRIGLGMMGLADAMIKLGIRYNSYEGLEFAKRVAQNIAQGALDFSEEIVATGDAEVPSDLAEAGIRRRNVAVTTVAPTGTTAMVAGTTSGVEPLFAPFIYRRVGAEYKQVLHPLFKDMMEMYRPFHALATWKPVESDDPNYEGAMIPHEWDWAKVAQAISDNHGSVQRLEGIPAEVQDVFVCAHDIRPIDHVRMQAMVQEGFDYPFPDRFAPKASNSISKTINLPKHAKVRDVMDTFLTGRDLGLKGITVYRDGSRDFQVLSTSITEDDGSTEDSQALDEQLGEIIAATCDLDGTCD